MYLSSYFFSFLQPDIVQLRDRLCRAQGKSVPGQESSRSSYERQPLPKGGPGPLAGHPQVSRVQSQQYYPQVSQSPGEGTTCGLCPNGWL